MTVTDPTLVVPLFANFGHKLSQSKSALGGIQWGSSLISSNNMTILVSGPYKWHFCIRSITAQLVKIEYSDNFAAMIFSRIIIVDKPGCYLHG